MAKEDRSFDRQRAISAAVRRFPQFELAIHRLMDRSDSFREICEELADSEFALLKVDKIAPALREARRAEWQELVDGLVREVGEVLNADAVRKMGTIPRTPR